MARQSKIAPIKPPAATVRDNPNFYYCTRCPREYKAQKLNFPKVQSPLYRMNDGYLYVCRHCVDELFTHYKDIFGDERSAIRRLCMIFDIYWSEKTYDMSKKNGSSASPILNYITKANLYQFAGKTYDDTLKEESAGIPSDLTDATIDSADSASNVIMDAADMVVTQEVVDFWGSGLTPSFYYELEQRYKYWCGDMAKSSDIMDVGERAVIKQICMLEVTITRDTAAGKPIDKSINALNNLLGSANLKPVQKKRDESLDANVESTPFGVWIRKIENTRPISEPDPEFADVDGVIKYISVWFFGHICKMLKIENKYSRLYEEEMARLRVERPEYEGEEDEAVFEDIFARASSTGGDSD